MRYIANILLQYGSDSYSKGSVRINAGDVLAQLEFDSGCAPAPIIETEVVDFIDKDGIVTCTKTSLYSQLNVDVSSLSSRI